MIFRYTRHAVQRMAERSISVEDVEQAVQFGKTVQEYPDDRPYPSFIALYVIAGKPLHVVYSRKAADGEEVIHVITVYRPDVREWDETFTQRR